VKEINMLRKLIVGAGMAYMARRFMGGGSRSMAPGMTRGGMGGGLFGGFRGRRGAGW
jgi:hypothetical protein